MLSALLTESSKQFSVEEKQTLPSVRYVLHDTVTGRQEKIDFKKGCIMYTVIGASVKYFEMIFQLYDKCAL